MHELLPVVLGALVGTAVMSLVPTRRRWLALPPACAAVGALASAVNGELAEGLPTLFVSFDALLAWAGAMAASVFITTTQTVRRNQW
jgi:hypothetical protein